MSSAIDATKPVTGVNADKADLRANFAAAKNEIEALQASKQDATLPNGWRPGAVARSVRDVLADLTVRDSRGAYHIDAFSAAGSVAGGVVDARAAFVSAFASGEHIVLQPATYKWSDIIDAGSLENITISGVPGITKITGDFGPRMLLLDNLANVEFYGIIFENTNNQASPDGAYGTVYSYQSVWNNARFRKCGFTAPNGNLNGLMVYVRTTPTDATNNAAIDGLLIEDCDFYDLGPIGS